MAELQSIEQKRRWTEIHDLLQDLIANPSKLDARTDTFYKMVYSENYVA